MSPTPTITTMTRTSLCAVVVGVLFLSTLVHLGDAATYSLSYEGIVSSKLVEEESQSIAQHQESRHNAPVQQQSLPQSFVKAISTNITARIVDLLHASYYSSSLAGTPSAPVIVEGDHKAALLECHCYQNAKAGTRCHMDHHVIESDDDDDDMSLHVSTHFYYTTDQKLVVASMDVKLFTTCTSSSADVLARDVLVRSIEAISHEIQYSSKNGPVWSIQSRPSVLEMQEEFWANNNDYATAVAHKADTEKTSLDNVILSNPRIQNRTRTDYYVSTSTTTATVVETWSHQEPGRNKPVTSLFVDSQLQATTSAAGAAHAEAFVHPALISHVQPERVAVISLTPVAIIKEVLKHKSVEDIYVVGANVNAMEMVKEQMPELDDCSALPLDTKSCMESDAVTVVVQEDVQTWIESMINDLPELEENDAVKKEGEEYVYDPLDECSVHPQFDVILLDIPQKGQEEWLSAEFHLELKKLLSHEAILVVNVGSTPSFDMTEEGTTSARDVFLQKLTKSTASHGIGHAAAFVYDEPMAAPLDTSFIISFPGDEAFAYDRFIRKDHTIVDIDLIERFHPQKGSDDARFVLPTVVYDGPTHCGYLKNSRAWEHWYCTHNIGKDKTICKEFLPHWFNASFHHYEFEVRRDPVKGRSLFATENIPAGHFQIPHDAAFSARLEKWQWEALNQFVQDFPDAVMYRQLRDFFITYGYEAEVLGSSGWTVSIACNNTLTNHACTAEEQNIKYADFASFDDKDGGGEEFGFSPVVVRRSELFGTLAVTKRDIEAGEEILVDYATFRTKGGADKDLDALLTSMCEEGVGLVAVGIDNNGNQT